MALAARKGIVMEFADWLRAHRARLRWSQTDLAERSGVAQTYISKLENAHKRTRLGVEAAQGIAKALGVPLDELLVAAGLGPPSPPDELTPLLAEALQVGVPRGVVERYRQEYPRVPAAVQQGMVQDLYDIIAVYRAAHRDPGQRLPPERGAHEGRPAAVEPAVETHAAPAYPGRYDAPPTVHEPVPGYSC